MTFLPIVERELRLAARQRATFWLRIVAAVTAVIIAAGAIYILSNSGGSSGPQLGGALFAVLTWLSLAVSLAAGLFFTADALSEEKRDGTLGFLFLTDLRGYDVVLGKLFATSCRGLFALLAIFPVLACTQLLGGVAVGQFWRTILALLHAMFFSLAVGMFVSALSRHLQKAFAGTFALLFLLLGGGAALDALLAHLTGTAFQPRLSLASPVTAFLQANGNFTTFWPALVVGQGVAWGLLAGACWLVPRNWQDKVHPNRATSPWRNWWRFGSARQREQLRLGLLDRNPMTWLACRERWQARVMWGLVAIVVVQFLITSLGDSVSANWISWMAISGLVWLFFHLWLVSQACQFFSELRRSGLLEILLAVPLDFKKVTTGAWLGLVRIFGVPVGLILLVQFLSQLIGQNGARLGMTPAGAETVLYWVRACFTGVCHITTSLANLIALSWFGLWMGLTSRNSLTATLKTILFVEIIPWLVLVFMMALVPMFLMTINKVGGGGPFTGWYPLIISGLATVLSISKDAGFWWVARKKLQSDFRTTATRAVLPVTPANPRRAAADVPKPD